MRHTIGSQQTDSLDEFMREYKLSFIKNIKRGFLTIPFGLLAGGFIVIIFGVDMISWQKILLIVIFGLIGLPGILIHLYYLAHDLSLRISSDPKNDFYEFSQNGQFTKIFKSDIESIEKINRDNRFIPWWGYMMFKIRLKNGNTYSITNLTIDFNELYDISKTKDRQLKIFDKFRLI
jgi:hypothetical protein